MNEGLLSRIVEVLVAYSDGDPVRAAAIGGGVAFLLTSLGGLAAAIVGPPKSRDQAEVFIDLGLSFSSGVMIVASFTSLLLPSIENFGLAPTLLGFIAGPLAIHAANKLVPHEHFFKGYEGPPAARRKILAAWLVAMAIIIHNVPEGISIGAASAYSARDGIMLALAIGIQDIPEGAAVAIPIMAANNRRSLAFAVAALSGASELMVSAPAAALSTYSLALLPVMMGFGAGAMVYVVSHEALPETHRSGREHIATVGFFAGFLLMLILDTALG